MNNRITIKNGNEIYLFKQDSKSFWLKKPSFDCGWYWGVGYLTGAGVWSHFDNMFKTYDVFVDAKFITPYDRDTRWKIYELITQLYNLRRYADMMHCCGAGISTIQGSIDKYEEGNTYEYKRINNVLIPTVWNRLVDVLVPDVYKDDELVADNSEKRKYLYLDLKEYC